MNISLNEKEKLGHCWRCGDLFNSRNIRNSIKCKTCGRPFHRKCFLAETGIPKEEETACVICLCGICHQPYSLKLRRNSLALKFLRDGYVVISLSKGSVDNQTILEKLAQCRERAEKYYRAFANAYESEAMISRSVPSLESGYSNFRERGKGRYEIIFPNIKEELVDILEKCDPLLDTLDVLLKPARGGLQWKLMSYGCFYSLPGSSQQVLHTDGPALTVVEDLFPYAINVFVPLVHMDKNNGTEFFPGSHRSDYSTARKKREAIAPTVPVGKALLFDYRVLHRGLRNKQGFHRPCYYATYTQYWYKDIFNFSATRYRKALHVPSYLLENRSERNFSKRYKTEKTSVGGI
uniref:Uncharacterized protein TCIL3000_3_2150 n=1 Tax=Trypanosoma congolense (strain IL3000) TaxID=1068625 RepID=G0UK78_TRYCI|nr:unnamed protein product [Trypanosoma congolense IL3000]